jgi:hypothetical protein
MAVIVEEVRMGDLRRIGVALVAVAAIPCLGHAATVSSEDYAVQYDYDEFRAASDGRNFSVVIAGNPFPALAAEDVARRLLPVMQANKPRPRLTFSYDRMAGVRRPDYRLVLVFDAANDLGADRVCNGVTRFKPHRSDQVEVFAVYCRNDVPMSQAIGRTAASAPEDKEVARLFAQLFQVVFSDAQIVRPFSGYPGGLR